MSNPRRYSISILENYSDKSLHEIAIVIAQKVLTVQPENFVLQNTEDLDLGVEFLHTPDDPFSWMYINDLLPIFNNFRDTCFCLSVSDGECGGEYRSLFFNGKAVKQYPEIRYPEFHINDFEYETSEKTPLEKIGDVVEKVEKAASEHLRKMAESMGESMFGYVSDAEKEVAPFQPKEGFENRSWEFAVEWDKTIDKALNKPDPVALDFIKKSLFGNIILENAQDA